MGGGGWRALGSTAVRRFSVFWVKDLGGLPSRASGMEGEGLL